MADILDIQNGLIAICVAAVYPNGTGSTSITGSAVRLFPGWPVPQLLDADLLAGASQISVFPTNTETNTTRYPKDWINQSVNAQTITAALTGQTVTIGGAQPTIFYAHIISINVNGQPYVYTTLQTDTLNTIAAALAALIPGAGVAGVVITMASNARVLYARVGITGTSVREIRRQTRVMQLTVWTSTPALRDTLGRAIDTALAATEFLTMPDGYGARLVYKGSHIIDDLMKAKLYRRDFLYMVEYATTQIEVDTSITQIQINESMQIGGSTAYTTPTTTYS